MKGAVLLVSLACLLGPALAQTGSSSAAEKWDGRYDREGYVYGSDPVEFLRQQVGRLGSGKALCLAAGEGRNAVFLAQHGFAVTAVDISARGLEKCLALAAARGVQVDTVVADLDVYDLGKEKWDLITDFYYHDLDLFPRVLAALKPGGRFIMQNFSLDHPDIGRFGPRNPEYLAGPNQALRPFLDWRIRHYEDATVQLDEGMHQGPGAVVRLIVEKVPAAVGDP